MSGIRNFFKRLRRDQLGFVTMEFVIAIPLLILPSALLVMQLPNWAEGQDQARVAASEAAKAIAVSGLDDHASEVAVAQQVVDQINAGYAATHKLDPSYQLVTLIDPDTSAVTGDASVRNANITVKTQAVEPFIHVAGLSIGTRHLVETHVEVVDRFRSGLNNGKNLGQP